MVSHDRYLIEACADRLWVVADGAVTNFDGDLDEYRRNVLSQRTRTDTEAARNGKADRPERPKSEKRAPLKQRIANAEAEMARISDIIAKIDAALAVPDIFTRDPKQAAQLSKARANAATALERAEEEWLEASSQFDEAGL
jgi:ATP-binding cassette, subfamily F, member 3